ncbi:hypothetical protein OM416_02330 [Paenibacillus sp. LS1]|uniref:hypothetical protein n=1 Tax=Paenibacillus sp. LS1 TaxID=2992120 RepID=UPI00223000F1|nr:hypothetical protein [Paenibacillus sp. LS1]MCW3790396.1 hypothetical protein [Paenibacillus sp. LS1]
MIQKVSIPNSDNFTGTIVFFQGSVLLSYDFSSYNFVYNVYVENDTILWLFDDNKERSIRCLEL